MRLPKTVNICGKSYVVHRNNKRWGGKGSTGNQTVVVGTKNDQSKERIFDNYLHEVVELVACEQGVKFISNDDEGVFVMNHKQFDQLVGSVASAIYPIIKK